MTNSALIHKYLNNGGIIRVIPAKRRKGQQTMPRVAQPPKRSSAQAYKFAVNWVATELDPHLDFAILLRDTHAILVAETFEKPIQYVCADIIAARQASPG